MRSPALSRLSRLPALETSARLGAGRAPSPCTPDGTMPRLLTDLELLDRWCEGDAQAGNDLFRRHFRGIYQFFRDKVHGDEDELIQATFFACVRSRDEFRRGASFRTFLFAIARNELYRYLRRRTRDANLDFGVTSLATLAPSPSSAVGLDERQARLVQALRRLPLQQQLVIELHYWEDMRPRELSVIFDIAEPTARLWLHRARQALREHLDRAGQEPAPEGRGAEELAAWARSLRSAPAEREDQEHQPQGGGRDDEEAHDP